MTRAGMFHLTVIGIDVYCLQGEEQTILAAGVPCCLIQDTIRILCRIIAGQLVGYPLQ